MPGSPGYSDNTVVFQLQMQDLLEAQGSEVPA